MLGSFLEVADSDLEMLRGHLDLLKLGLESLRENTKLTHKFLHLFHERHARGSLGFFTYGDSLVKVKESWIVLFVCHGSIFCRPTGTKC